MNRAASIARESRSWDGHNHISDATGSQWEHEEILRTASGTWILHHWSQWQGSRDTYDVVSAEGAAAWILRNSSNELPAELSEHAAIGEV